MKSLVTLSMFSLILCLVSCYPVYNLNKPAPIRSVPSSYDNRPVGKPGSCYAKCLIPPEMQYDTLNLPIYLKDDHQTNPKVNTRTLVTRQASEMWVKKFADKNCISKDPNDCLVWCLVEVPAIVDTYHVLTDTIGSSDYKVEEVLIGEILNAGTTDWREVLCQEKAESIYPQLSTKLSELNYLEKETEDKNLIKNALLTFQEKSELPQGNLDFETLDALGIIY